MKLKATKQEILNDLYAKRYEFLKLKKQATGEFKFYVKGQISALNFVIAIFESWTANET